MTAAALRLGDQWGITAATDRRFRALSVGSLVLVLATMLVLQSWSFMEPEPEPEPLRVTLLPPPPPPPRVKPAVEPPVAKSLPKPVPKPAQAQAKAAPAMPAPRELAARSGLMAMRDQLSSMRDSAAVAGPPALLRDSTASTSSRRSGETLAASAASGSSGSSGIGSGSRSVTAVQGSGSIGARRTAEVQSALGSGKAGAGGSGEDAGGSRSLKELQLAFDRNKSSLFSIFSRAARESADIGAGKIVVSLTIAPDGSVTRCELVSSSFGNPELEQKILQRVRMLNFGAKNVPPYTYANYPINFLPS